jgi:hypothetical protein
LCFDYGLRIDEPLALALTQTGLLGRVYRLNLSAQLEEPAARILAENEGLRTVRAFSYFWCRSSMESIRALLHSAYLTGVWDVHLSLPDARNEKSIEAVCADSPLLNQAIALDLNGPDQSPLIPRSGRLGRVRRLGEWLFMHVFGDARLATVWHENPIGRPLRAQLGRFIEQTYRVEHRLEDLPGLEKKLLGFPAFHDESGFKQTLQALLATSFGGKPAAQNAKFADLNGQEQSALRAIAQVEGDWWNINGMMHSLMMSYGFRFWDKERLEKYIAGTEETSNG